MSRVGVVFGAGGVTGEAYHRGVIRALLEVGFDPRNADALVGTSAGSLVSASLRAPRRTALDLPDPIASGAKLPAIPAMSALLAAARRPLRTRPGVIVSSLLPTGRRSLDFVVDGLGRRYGREWPDRTLYIVGVRRRDGRRIVFGRSDAPVTDVAHAVAASCAIPGYFHPVLIDGEHYVDGGVHSPTNADLLAAENVDVVLVSSPMSVVPRGARPAADIPLRLYWHTLLRREVRRLHRAGKRVITFEPHGRLTSTMGLNPLGGARLDEIEETAYEQSLQRLESDGTRGITQVLAGIGRVTQMPSKRRVANPA
jgi:NTE family protein